MPEYFRGYISTSGGESAMLGVVPCQSIPDPSSPSQTQTLNPALTVNLAAAACH